MIWEGLILDRKDDRRKFLIVLTPDFRCDNTKKVVVAPAYRLYNRPEDYLDENIIVCAEDWGGSFDLCIIRLTIRIADVKPIENRINPRVHNKLGRVGYLGEPVLQKIRVEYVSSQNIIGSVKDCLKMWLP